MSNNPPASAALILVPIAIVASAAYIAIKTSEFTKRTVHFLRGFCIQWSPANIVRNRVYRKYKQRCSDLSSQNYGDSWCDLESVREEPLIISNYNIQSSFNSRKNIGESGQNSEFQNETTRIWHPTRDSRLTWSFMNPESLPPNLFELSNVVKPLPDARRLGRHTADDADLQVARRRAEEVHH
jgi:hypothetical protein